MVDLLPRGIRQWCIAVNTVCLVSLLRRSQVNQEPQPPQSVQDFVILGASSTCMYDRFTYGQWVSSWRTSVFF